MRTLSHFEVSRALVELMQYTHDSGQAVKIIKPGGGTPCALISFYRLESLMQQLKRANDELAAIGLETRAAVRKAMESKEG